MCINTHTLITFIHLPPENQKKILRNRAPVTPKLNPRRRCLKNSVSGTGSASFRDGSPRQRVDSWGELFPLPLPLSRSGHVKRARGTERRSSLRPFLPPLLPSPLTFGFSPPPLSSFSLTYYLNLLPLFLCHAIPSSPTHCPSHRPCLTSEAIVARSCNMVNR